MQIVHKRENVQFLIIKILIKIIMTCHLLPIGKDLSLIEHEVDEVLRK